MKNLKSKIVPKTKNSFTFILLEHKFSNSLYTDYCLSVLDPVVGPLNIFYKKGWDI